MLVIKNSVASKKNEEALKRKFNILVLFKSIEFYAIYTFKKLFY